MPRQQFRKIVQIASNTDRLTQTNLLGVAAGVTTNIFIGTIPAGVVGEIVAIQLTIPKPTGAISGTHKTTLYWGNDHYVKMAEGTFNFDKDIVFEYGTFNLDGLISMKPASHLAMQNAFKALISLDDPLIVEYSNNTNQNHLADVTATLNVAYVTRARSD